MSMRIAALLTVAMVIFGGVPVFAQGQQTSQRLAEMRAALVAAAVAQSRNEAAIHAKVEAIRAAELALAKARATSRTASLCAGVFIDNDPTYFRSNGKIGLEVESTGGYYTRNIFLKRM